MQKLEHNALFVLLDHWRLKSSHDGLVENVLETLLSERRALDVLDGAELSGELVALLVGHGSQLVSGELVENHLIASQIDLGADNEAGHAGAVVVDLGEPLLLDVFKRRGRGDGEAHEEHVGLGVTQRSKSVVIFLSGGVEQTEGVGLVSDPGLVFVGVFHRRLLLRRRLRRRVARKQSQRVKCLPLNRARYSHDGHGIVVENGGHVFRGELVCCV